MARQTVWLKSSDSWKISDVARPSRQFEARLTRSSTTSIEATTLTASSSSCRFASPSTKLTNVSGYLLRYVYNSKSHIHRSFPGYGFTTLSNEDGPNYVNFHTFNSTFSLVYLNDCISNVVHSCGLEIHKRFFTCANITLFDCFKILLGLGYY